MNTNETIVIVSAETAGPRLTLVNRFPSGEWAGSQNSAVVAEQYDIIRKDDVLQLRLVRGGQERWDFRPSAAPKRQFVLKTGSARELLARAVQDRFAFGVRAEPKGAWIDVAAGSRLLAPYGGRCRFESGVLGGNLFIGDKPVYKFLSGMPELVSPLPEYVRAGDYLGVSPVAFQAFDKEGGLPTLLEDRLAAFFPQMVQRGVSKEPETIAQEAFVRLFRGVLQVPEDVKKKFICHVADGFSIPAKATGTVVAKRPLPGDKFSEVVIATTAGGLVGQRIPAGAMLPEVGYMAREGAMLAHGGPGANNVNLKWEFLGQEFGDLFPVYAQEFLRQECRKNDDGTYTVPAYMQDPHAATEAVWDYTATRAAAIGDIVVHGVVSYFLPPLPALRMDVAGKLPNGEMFRFKASPDARFWKPTAPLGVGVTEELASVT